jgi:hypothetical protein
MTLFFDKDSDSQREEEIREVGVAVSTALKCPVLAVLNHDDDILCYWLFEAGIAVDEYNSCPGYFSGEDPTPIGGDAGKLCAAFGVPEFVNEVDEILRREDYVFALDRHEALAKSLKIPWSYGCVGFEYLAADDYPEGLSSVDFTRVI